MATPFSWTLFRNYLKIQYPDGPELLLYKASPFVGWMEKDTDFEGDSYQVNPLVNGIRSSNDFATALDERNTPSTPRFNVTMADMFSIGTIANKAIAACRSSKGGIKKAVTAMVDAGYYGFGRNLAYQVWGSGSGSIGRDNAAWVTPATSVTLLTPEDACKFEVGMRLQSSATDGTGVVKPGFIEVASISRQTGVVTFTASPDVGIPTFAASDFLFPAGNYANALTGVLAWVPPVLLAAPFYGVVRTADADRLGGIRFTGAGPIEEQVIDAEALGVTAGGQFDTLWMHPKRISALKKNIHGKAFYMTEPKTSVSGKKMNGDTAKIAYQGFVFAGDYGPITVMSDLTMPYAYGLLTKRGTWKLISMKELPHFDVQAGDKFLTEAAQDGKQFRLIGYPQVVCERPLDNVLITWA